MKDIFGDKIITNKRTVGTPRYWTINGQKLFSGTDMHIRSKVFAEIKKYLVPYLRKVKPIETYPIGIRMDMYETPDSWDWDVDNHSYIWIKNFSDCLEREKIIPKDNIVFIRSNGYCVYHPVKDEADRKLVFTIFKEDDYELQPENKTTSKDSIPGME